MKRTQGSYSIYQKNVSVLSLSIIFVLAVMATVTNIDAQRIAGKTAMRGAIAAKQVDWKQARMDADSQLASGYSEGSMARANSFEVNAPTANPTLYAYNFTTDHLISFAASTPGTLLTDIPVVGLNLANNEFLESIDFRPVNGVLYGIANDPTLNVSRFVSINTTTGQLTQIGATFPTASGLFYAGDFNPVVDRFREVSSDRVNRRIDPGTGAIVATDTAVAFAAGDVNAGITPQVSQLAYTNNTSGAQFTTLYGIDSVSDTLVRVGSVNGTPISPNSGQLFTIGGLGANVGGFGGFDIQQGTNLAYAVLRVAGVSSLYSINLNTGAATLIGAVGNGADAIDGLAIGFSPTAASADLAVTKTDNKATYVPGGTNVYTITVTNAGPDPVVGASLSDVMPAQFSGWGWTCAGANGGSCGLSNGFSNINTTFSVPVGGTVTYTVSGTVAGNANGNIVNTVTVATPAGVTDPNAANNSATDTDNLQPTAAGVTVGGRVVDPSGRGLRGVTVSMTDSQGIRRNVLTSSLGYYQFEDVEAGGTYVMAAVSRSYRFGSKVIQINDNLSGVDFVGQE